MDQTSQIEPLYVFAVFMLGSRDAAFTAVCGVMGEHVGDREAWLPALVSHLVTAEKTTRVDRFAELNDILRTNSTIPVDLSHPLVQGDARRLNLLLWELQRSCLITTLRGLTSERRAVFTLMHVLGLSMEDTAAACSTSVAAVRTTESRARKDLEGYLGPRCEHLDANNPCHCAARLGNALEAGLVHPPAHADFDESTFDLSVRGQVVHLYNQLPRVHLPIV